MENNTQYQGIGIMSGTSLDGMDIAFCRFILKNNSWEYDILAAETFPYSGKMKKQLGSLRNCSASALVRSENEWSRFASDRIHDFCEKYKLEPEFIASHGHTVFHQPGEGLTLQIGNGALMAARTGVPVICDFRRADTARGGQGAPLVPIGDRYLFGTYDLCLNLGGFANVSFEEHGIRKACDICPCNVLLNHVASTLGKAFDQNGETAREGKVLDRLLKKLNGLDFYRLTKPRSLGMEWVQKHLFPLVPRGEDGRDLLRTFTEHIARQVTQATGRKPPGRLLVTGGGAYNVFLLERIKALTGHEVIIPGQKLIDHKEALIFAFMGIRRLRNEVNVLGSATGANKDHSAGAVYI